MLAPSLLTLIDESSVLTRRSYRAVFAYPGLTVQSPNSFATPYDPYATSDQLDFYIIDEGSFLQNRLLYDSSPDHRTKISSNSREFQCPEQRKGGFSDLSLRSEPQEVHNPGDGTLSVDSFRPISCSAISSSSLPGPLRWPRGPIDTSWLSWAGSYLLREVPSLHDTFTPRTSGYIGKEVPKTCRGRPFGSIRRVGFEA
jgi:hypothetical protein